MAEGEFLCSLKEPFDIARQESTGPKRQKTAFKSKNLSILGSDSDQETAFSSEESDSEAEISEKPLENITPELVAALDRANTSSRKASIILNAQNKNAAFSKSAIHRRREVERTKIASAVRRKFNPGCFLTVHWDEKQLPDYYHRKRFERLAIVVTGPGIEQFLCAPALEHGTGLAQAEATFEALQKWRIVKNTVAMACDTPSTNMGHTNGAAALLEDLLQKELLLLACRHHVMEIPLEAVFKSALGAFSSPEVPLFKKFKDNWETFDQTNFVTGVQDRYIRAALSEDKDIIVAFLKKQLLEFQPRGDYEELLNLLLIFAGEVPANEAKFNPPGAYIRAQWMMFAIYSLKLWFFQKEFSLTAEEKKGIRQVCLYVFKVHAKSWYTAPLSLSAPRLDLELLRKLEVYSKKSAFKTQAERALEKFKGHLWYLGERLVALAFFDPEVPTEEKLAMVAALKSDGEGSDQLRRRVIVRPTDTLKNFVSSNSMFLFQQLNINTTFLEKHPSTWESDPGYLRGRDVCKSLTVINDAAERAVCLVKDYINKLCKKEDSFQNLLQVVHLHRQLCPVNATSSQQKVSLDFLWD